MRDVKFRAWDGVFNEMIPWDRLRVEEDGVSVRCGISTWNECVTDIHLMEFTGLTTREGIELYEGDICTQKRLGEDIVFEIIFRWGMFMAKIRHVEFVLKTACENDHNHGLPITVIGNIHESPELLRREDV